MIFDDAVVRLRRMAPAPSGKDKLGALARRQCRNATAFNKAIDSISDGNYEVVQQQELSTAAWIV